MVEHPRQRQPGDPARGPERSGRRWWLWPLAADAARLLIAGARLVLWLWGQEETGGR